MVERAVRAPAPAAGGDGAANLAYGTYSGALAGRALRPRGLLVLLVAANATWAGLCVLAAVALADTASTFGLAHLLGEGLLVGGWRFWSGASASDLNRPGIAGASKT